MPTFSYQGDPAMYIAGGVGRGLSERQELDRRYQLAQQQDALRLAQMQQSERFNVRSYLDRGIQRNLQNAQFQQGRYDDWRNRLLNTQQQRWSQNLAAQVRMREGDQTRLAGLYDQGLRGQQQLQLQEQRRLYQEDKLLADLPAQLAPMLEQRQKLQAEGYTFSGDDERRMKKIETDMTTIRSKFAGGQFGDPNSPYAQRQMERLIASKQRQLAMIQPTEKTVTFQDRVRQDFPQGLPEGMYAEPARGGGYTLKKREDYLTPQEELTNTLQREQTILEQARKLYESQIRTEKNTLEGTEKQVEGITYEQAEARIRARWMEIEEQQRKRRELESQIDRANPATGSGANPQGELPPMDQGGAPMPGLPGTPGQNHPDLPPGLNGGIPGVPGSQQAPGLPGEDFGYDTGGGAIQRGPHIHGEPVEIQRGPHDPSEPVVVQPASGYPPGSPQAQQAEIEANELLGNIVKKLVAEGEIDPREVVAEADTYGLKISEEDARKRLVAAGVKPAVAVPGQKRGEVVPDGANYESGEHLLTKRQRIAQAKTPAEKKAAALMPAQPIITNDVLFDVKRPLPKFARRFNDPETKAVLDDMRKAKKRATSKQEKDVLEQMIRLTWAYGITGEDWPKSLADEYDRLEKELKAISMDAQQEDANAAWGAYDQ